MPELGTTKPYQLPRLDYTPPRFDFRAPPQLAVDTSAASTMKGSAITLANVAETLARLPEVISGGIQKGRSDAQKKIVSGIKMGALSGGLSDEEKKRYSGLVFGADDTVQIRAEDPELELMKAQAYHNRAFPPPTLYEQELARATGQPLPTPGNGAPVFGGRSIINRPGNTTPPGSVVPDLPTQEEPLPSPPEQTKLPDPDSGALSGGIQPKSVLDIVDPKPALQAAPEGGFEKGPANNTRVDAAGTIHYYDGAGNRNSYLTRGANQVTVVKPNEVAEKPLPGVAAEASAGVKAGYTADQWAKLSEEKKAEALRKTIEEEKKTSSVEGWIEREVIKRGGNPTEMSTQQRLDYIQSSAVPLTASQKISAQRDIRSTYHEMPSTIALFGKGQMTGVDQIKTKLDEMVRGVGGDLSKLNPQEQKTFIFQMNKLNDPNSAVLIGEYKAAADTIGVLDKVGLLYGKAKEGQQVTPEQVRDVYAAVNAIHEAIRKDYVRDIPDFLDGAKELGVSPRRIGIPQKAERWLQATTGEQKEGQPQATPGAPGTVMMTKNGKVATFPAANAEKAAALGWKPL